MRASSSPIEVKPDSSAPDSLFTFVLVKPTHYDDDGYPIQWFRSALPSNTLACMNSLAELYWAMGDYAKAEPLYQEAFRIRQKVLPPDDPGKIGRAHV